MNKNLFLIITSVAAILLSLILTMANLYLGPVNQDEGFYLYAAKQVSQGKTLYRDTAFTQGPVMPYIYSLFYGMVKTYGVAAGRLLTTILGFLSALIAAAATYKIASSFCSQNDSNSNQLYKISAALGVFILIACNVYQSYFTTIVKTYALCALLLTSGFFALSFMKNPKFGGMAPAAGGIFLALAAGTRISAGIILPIVGIWLIIRSFDDEINQQNYPTSGQYWGQKLSWLWFGLGGGLTLILLALPFLMTAREGFLFGLFQYHAGRQSGNLLSVIILKAGFLSRFVQAYLIFTIGTLFVLINRLKALRVCLESPKILGITPTLLWICAIAVTSVHFSAPFPYDDYQVIIYPIFVMALMLTLIYRVPQNILMTFVFFLLIASIATAFSSPINQDWFVRGQDKIWWQFKEKSDLAYLQEVGKYVQEHTPPQSTILTQDVYLAVETNRNVPKGMELGPFSYYPDMPTEKAQKFNVINRKMMMDILKNDNREIAALSGYSLSIQCPQITEISQEEQDQFTQLLEENYQLDKTFPYFGQALTTLKIYTRKKQTLPTIGIKR